MGPKLVHSPTDSPRVTQKFSATVEFGGICQKQNPKVWLLATLHTVMRLRRNSVALKNDLLTQLAISCLYSRIYHIPM